MPDEFWLNIGHCELYVAETWILLFSSDSYFWRQLNYWLLILNWYSLVLCLVSVGM